jgi:plasmid stability protein
MSNYLTIRKIPEDLDKALQHEKKRRGKSTNQTVIELLRQALNLEWTSKSANGLEKLAGSWSQKELDRFEKSVSVFEHVDEEHWR